MGELDFRRRWFGDGDEPWDPDTITQFFARIRDRLDLEEFLIPIVRLPLRWNACSSARDAFPSNRVRLKSTDPTPVATTGRLRMIAVWLNRERTEAHVVEKGWLRSLRATGDRMEPTWTSPELLLVRPAKPEDSFSCGPMTIVSDRLLDVVRRHADSSDFEALPVNLRSQDKPVGEYFFLNILREVDAVDRRTAKFTMDGDMIDEIHELAIDETSVKDATVFRLRSWTRVTCLNEAIAQDISMESLDGPLLVSPRAWASHFVI